MGGRFTKNLQSSHCCKTKHFVFFKVSTLFIILTRHNFGRAYRLCKLPMSLTSRCRQVGIEDKSGDKSPHSKLSNQLPKQLLQNTAFILSSFNRKTCQDLLDIERMHSLSALLALLYKPLLQVIHFFSRILRVPI